MANRPNEELEELDLILRGAHKSYAMHIYVPGFTRDEHDLLHAARRIISTRRSFPRRATGRDV